MPSPSAEELRNKKCVPCEGGVESYSEVDAREQLESLDGWKLSDDARSISRKWTVQNFQSGLDFVNSIGAAAEEADHHPDLHLTGYRHVKVELTTHAIGGLSENDFILAARIDAIPVKLEDA